MNEYILPCGCRIITRPNIISFETAELEYCRIHKAAPQLLGALINLEARCALNNRFPELRKQARAAIDTATGEQNE